MFFWVKKLHWEQKQECKKKEKNFKLNKHEEKLLLAAAESLLMIMLITKKKKVAMKAKEAKKQKVLAICCIKLHFEIEWRRRRGKSATNGGEISPTAF